MQRVMVLGSPGAGKSTFAKALGNKTGLPVYHADCLFWNTDKTCVEKSVIDARIIDVASKDSWIIDGNYIRTLEYRINRCDKIFLLDYPLEVCLDGIYSRIGTKRDDLPWIEEKLDEEFLEFTKAFHTTKIIKIRDLLKKYSDKDIIIFKTRADADKYLKWI